MQLEIFDIAVVVTAEENNPTILHPEFLRSQNIVPKEWEIAEGPICTPPFSMVKFANGLLFTVESKKLQVEDTEPPKDYSLSVAHNYALKYLQALPHVLYTGVGINLKGFIEWKESDKLVIERFLKTGPWNDDALSPEGFGLRLVYPVGKGILRLSIDSGKLQRPKDSPGRNGILLSANYHKDLFKSSYLADAKEAISLFTDHCAHFAETIKTIFGMEE